jgi:hypothetical protein
MNANVTQSAESKQYRAAADIVMLFEEVSFSAHLYVLGDPLLLLTKQAGSSDPWF